MTLLIDFFHQNQPFPSFECSLKQNCSSKQLQQKTLKFRNQFHRAFSIRQQKKASVNMNTNSLIQYIPVINNCKGEDRQNLTHMPRQRNHFLDLNLTLPNFSFSFIVIKSIMRNLKQQREKQNIKPYMLKETKLFTNSLSQIRKMCKLKKDYRDQHNQDDRNQHDQDQRNLHHQFLETNQENRDEAVSLKLQVILDFKDEFLPSKQAEFHRQKHQQKRPQQSNAQQKNMSLRAIEHLYIQIQQSDIHLHLRCYFLDATLNRLRIRHKSQKLQLMQNALNQFRFNSCRDQSFVKQSIKSNEFMLRVNPQTGQICMEARLMTASKTFSSCDLLQHFVSGIKHQKKELFQQLLLLTQGKKSVYFQNSQKTQKFQNLHNQCIILVKSKLEQRQTQLEGLISHYKELEKKLFNQQLLAYTFPDKVSEYEIMDDPFLRHDEKMRAIKKLGLTKLLQKEAKRSQFYDIVQFQNSKITKKQQVQLAYSRLFIAIKRNLNQISSQIQKFTIKPKLSHCKSYTQQKTSEFCTSMPVIPIRLSKHLRDNSLLNQLNIQLVRHQIQKIKGKNFLVSKKPQILPPIQSAASMPKSKLQSTMKLPHSFSSQKFYTFTLVQIEQLQQKLHVQKLFRQSSVDKFRDKQHSLGCYLFDYKNLEIYEKFLAEEEEKQKETVNKLCPPPANVMWAPSNVVYTPQTDFIFSDNDFFCNTSSFQYSASEIKINIKNQPDPRSLKFMQIDQVSMLDQSSGFGISKSNQNQQQNLNLTLKKNNSLFPSLNDFSNFSQDFSKQERKPWRLKQFQMPLNLFFQDSLLLSIKSAFRVVPLCQFLSKNQKTLRFHRKLSIFKQVVEFYYLLQYFSLQSQISLNFEDIFITKSMTVKIDCGLYKSQVRQNKSYSIYFSILKIFTEIFMEKKMFQPQGQTASTQPQKLGGNQSRNSSSKYLELQTQKGKRQDENRKDYQNYRSFKKQLQDAAFTCFAQTQHLRSYGEVSSLKLIWTLLIRYASNVQFEQGQFYYQKLNMSWLHILVLKLDQLNAMKMQN